MAHFFNNSCTRLFRIYPDGPVLCTHSILESINMSKGHGTSWSCEYCGSTVSPRVYICPGCQNPRSVANMECVAVFRGTVSYAMHLFGLGEQDVMEVVVGSPGARVTYENSVCVMRLHHFEIGAITIPGVMAMCSDEVERLDCWVTTQCEVEMYFDRLLKAQERD